MKPLLFYTARLPYSGEDAISVARKRVPGESAEGLEFAPSWDILTPYIRLRQQGLETEEARERYAEAYQGEMRLSYRNHYPAWEALLSRPRAVLCCFCDLVSHVGRCHRLLLRDILKKCGAVYLSELGTVRTGSHWLDLGAAEGRAR